jgi:hypothetical protein
VSAAGFLFVCAVAAGALWALVAYAKRIGALEHKSKTDDADLEATRDALARGSKRETPGEVIDDLKGGKF